MPEHRKKPTLHLGGELPAEVVESFRGQCEERHQQKYGALAAAVKVWTELPAELQARLLNRSEGQRSFLEIVEQIVDKQLSKHRRRLHKDFEEETDDIVTSAQADAIKQKQKRRPASARDS